MEAFVTFWYCQQLRICFLLLNLGNGGFVAINPLPHPHQKKKLKLVAICNNKNSVQKDKRKSLSKIWVLVFSEIYVFRNLH